MIQHPPDLSSQFRAALEEYLGAAGESALARAHEVGRRAIRERLRVVDLTALQYGALLEILSRLGFPDREVRLIRCFQRVFLEGLSAFDLNQGTGEPENGAARRLNQALEQEIKRFAHLLHGEAGQLLVAVHLALDDVAGGLPPGERAGLEKVKGLLHRMEEELRRLSHELRPTALDDLGLLAALEFLSEGISKRSGVTITVDGPEERFPPAVETALYRVVQEALNNIVRHARANRTAVRFYREGNAVRCSIRDNGIGFDVAQALARRNGERGFGLDSMRERLEPLRGKLQVVSTPGAGTEISASLPVEG